MSWIKWIIYEVVLSAKCKKRLKIVFYFRNTISFIEPVGNYTFTNFNFRGGKISIVKLLPHAFYICFYVTIFLKFYMMQRKKNQTQFWVLFTKMKFLPHCTDNYFLKIILAIVKFLLKKITVMLLYSDISNFTF